MIGPQRPPSAAAAPARPPSDDEDDYAPMLPPGYVKPVAGPSRPSPPPAQAARPAYDNDSDDEVGPRPPPATGSSRADYDPEAEFRARERREAERKAEAAKPKKLHREDWMLRPPTEAEAMRNLDPTKLKARTFAPATTKKAASFDSSLWTETPDERAQRQADEVLGKRKKLENSDVVSTEEDEQRARKRTRDAEMRAQVESYNKANRSTSLLDQRAQAAKPTGDEAPAAIWDRDRDLGVGNKLMAEGKKKEFIADAKHLSSKFSGGSYL